MGYDVLVLTSLIDMCRKNGDVEIAQLVFNMIQEPWLGSFRFFAQTTYLDGGKIIRGCIYSKGLKSNLNLTKPGNFH
ncbi:hypothetical protein CFP56_001988 [Quercus suber]|uniref:Pentatricopeptide repeat-containing protein n=1 Tax=Quercus suber TaxID=58331 RepID=A0AAW0LDS9_QUESU